MTDFDLVVIGGGPGGYVASIRSAQAGKKTALIERDSLGGVCLNWGCIPTKALLRNAEIIGNLFKGDLFGFEAEKIEPDYEKAYVRSRRVSAKMAEGVKYLLAKNQVTVFSDEARFIGPREILLCRAKQKIRAKNVVIATGASSAHLPFLDYGELNVLDSRKALQRTSAPQSVIIVGAGAVGMEFATIFSAYGTKVSVIEMMEHILPTESQILSDVIEKEYRGKRQVDFYTGTRITAVKNDGVTVTAALERGGKDFSLSAECILTAAGIRPNSSGLNLSSLDVRTDERGFIPVDENMRTSVKNVYAIGDVTGKLALAHVASAQGILAVDHICGKPVSPIEYDNIPRCTYTEPEVASAGLDENAAASRGYDVGAAIFPQSANGKSIAYGESAGVVKLVYDKKFGQLLGAHMCGVHVTEMIGGMVGYLGMEMTVDEMKRVVYPHPTASEGILEAAHIASGEALHI